MPDFKRAMQDALQRESEKKAVRKPRLRPDELVEARRRELANESETDALQKVDRSDATEVHIAETNPPVVERNDDISPSSASMSPPVSPPGARQAIDAPTIVDGQEAARRLAERPKEMNRVQAAVAVSTTRRPVPLSLRVRGQKWLVLVYLYRQVLSQSVTDGIIVRPVEVAHLLGLKHKTVQVLLGRLRDEGHIFNYPEECSPGPGGYGVYGINPKTFEELQVFDLL